METIVDLWRNLPLFIKLPLDFVVYVILLRGVLGNDITSWLKERGLVKDSKDSYTWKFLDFVYNSIMSVRNFIKDKVLSTERKQIFWKHEVDRHGESLLVCTKDGCQLLG